MVKVDFGPASSTEARPEDLVGRVEAHEFVDDSYDRRVLTSTSSQSDALDEYQDDNLPKGWFSWRK